MANGENGGTRALVPVHNDEVAMLDTGKFEHMWRVAKAMALSNLMPQHLKGGNHDQTAANCLRIVNQAVRWGIDPFAMMDETYVVSGKLGYQGKLVAAIVNRRGGLDGRLTYEFSGSGENRTVKVSGTFEGDDEPSTIELSVKQAKTTNKMWTSDPDQKLVYSAVTKWARRHCPEVLLGVLTDDDLDRMHQDAIPAEYTVHDDAHRTTDTRSQTERLNDELAERFGDSLDGEAEAEADATPDDDESAPVGAKGELFENSTGEYDR